MSSSRSSARPLIVGPGDGMRQGDRIAPHSDHVISVPEADLTCICVDHETRFRFGATEVVVASEFRLAVEDREYDLNPNNRALLGPVLTLYPGTLVQALVAPGGKLTLKFASGARIEVPADQCYEAWQVHGPGSRLIVCEPGGKNLSVWE